MGKSTEQRRHTQEANEMLAGDTGEIDTSTFERQAVRMMIAKKC